MHQESDDFYQYEKEHIQSEKTLSLSIEQVQMEIQEMEKWMEEHMIKTSSVKPPHLGGVLSTNPPQGIMQIEAEAAISASQDLLLQLQEAETKGIITPQVYQLEWRTVMSEKFANTMFLEEHDGVAYEVVIKTSGSS